MDVLDECVQTFQITAINKINKLIQTKTYNNKDVNSDKGIKQKKVAAQWWFDYPQSKVIL